MVDSNIYVSCQLPVEISIPNSEQPTGYMYIETAWQMWSSNPDKFVQIIHVSSDHWACLSNKFSSPGNVDLFETLYL